MAHDYVLRTDGGSRSNPGPAGIGFTLEQRGEEAIGGGAFIGEATNNVAEYLAMAWGLENAVSSGVRKITVLADSELVVKQLNGQYKVKNEGLKPYFLLVKSFFSRFDLIEVAHIYRAENKVADAYANAAMDERAEVGTAVVAFASSAGNDVLNPPQTSLF